MERYLSYYNFDPIQLIRCQRDEQHYFRLIANDKGQNFDNKLETTTLSEALLQALAELLEPNPSPRLIALKTNFATYELRFLEFDVVAKRYHGEWTSSFLFGVGIGYRSFSVSHDSLERFYRDVRHHLDQIQTMASRT